MDYLARVIHSDHPQPSLDYSAKKETNANPGPALKAIGH